MNSQDLSAPINTSKLADNGSLGKEEVERMIESMADYTCPSTPFDGGILSPSHERLLRAVRGEKKAP